MVWHFAPVVRNGTRKSKQLPRSQSRELPPPETIKLSETEFRACLSALAKQNGSIAELAARLGVSGQFLGDVIAGRKHAGKKLLGCFGGRIVWVGELPV